MAYGGLNLPVHRGLTAGVSGGLEVQCAMTSFSCHLLFDQRVKIFQNLFFLFPCVD